MTGRDIVAGVDEVGRGPLAGPVIAAAVILNTDSEIVGLKDSKQLSECKRNYYAKLIKKHAYSWAFGRAEVEEIDNINILQASLLAMRRAVCNLDKQPDQILIDGPYVFNSHISCKAIIKGDSLFPCISAASIIAKVKRDEEMTLLSTLYPDYDFSQNKGYPTKKHLVAIKKYGICVIHRKSFKPVKAYC